MRTLIKAALIAIVMFKAAGCGRGDPDSVTESASSALVANTGPLVTIFNPKPNQHVTIGVPFVVKGVAGSPFVNPVDLVMVQVDNLPPVEATSTFVGGGISFTANVFVSEPPGAHVITAIGVLDNGM